MLSKPAIERTYISVYETTARIVNDNEEHEPVLLPFVKDCLNDDGTPKFGMPCHEIAIRSLPRVAVAKAHHALVDVITSVDQDGFVILVSECFYKRVEMGKGAAEAMTQAERDKLVADFKAEPASGKESAIFFSFIGADWQCFGYAMIEKTEGGGRRLGDAQPLEWIGENCKAFGPMAREEAPPADVVRH